MSLPDVLVEHLLTNIDPEHGFYIRGVGTSAETCTQSLTIGIYQAQFLTSPTGKVKSGATVWVKRIRVAQGCPDAIIRTRYE